MRMVDKNMRRKILSELEKLWDKYPDQRLGQLLENYVFFKGQRGDTTSVRLFFQLDEETLEILKTSKKKKILEGQNESK
jgi:mRNA-degrading endonuclease RelE of RelBE toxin-antitoxin system